MPQLDHAFNVLLTADHKAMLTQLAQSLECSRGHVIRESIRFRFAITCNATPTCASGRPCLVPALHQPPATPPVALPPGAPPQPQVQP